MIGLNGISRAKVEITLFDENNKQIQADIEIQQEMGRQITKALKRISLKPFWAMYNDPKKILMEFLRRN